MIDLEKRKRVMERSIKLGHCICNPKQGCPCDLFKEKDICLCAGERLEETSQEVRLTTLVENPGCASKINQNDLQKVLAALPAITDPRVLVSAHTCDDAGVYSLDDQSALVQSVDVFAPSVDDPYAFGQIAAANSLSDIYAMGGRPLTALSIIGFPVDTLSHWIMSQIMRGGLHKMQEAGVTVIGGHSINDRDLKFGFAVTGLINPSRIVTNDKVQVGDALVLTKPIGVGVIAFANQLGRASPSAMADIARSMGELNKVAAEIMLEMGVQAATDVTGFGLLGHLSEMVRQSRVAVEIFADQVSVFPAALDYIRQGIISGAAERNKDYASQYVTSANDVSEEMQYLLYDPQTSGGLLMAIPDHRAHSLVARLREKGVQHAAVIGRATAPSKGEIVVKKTQTRASRRRPLREAKVEQPHEVASAPCCEPEAQPECCAAPPETSEEQPAATAPIKEKFTDFVRQASAQGALSVQQKELIAIALSLVCKCEPCAKIHIGKARALGLSNEEIEEAAWMAIAFGGAPTLMFYDSLKQKR